MEPSSERQQSTLGLYIRGVAMGAADVVPGVSGGTVAFITGIYQELIRSLSAFNLSALKLLLAGQWSELWAQVNGRFLLPLFAGVFTSFLSLVKVVSWLLEAHPKMVWSYFMGLILASAVMIGRQIAHTQLLNWGMLLVGAAFAYQIGLLTHRGIEPSTFYLFICAMIAICAMILPGISGSFILVLLGVYHYVIAAVKDLEIAVLVVFFGGCVTGLLIFTRVLSFFLVRFEQATLALLTGFMLGSLNKVWPWKYQPSEAVAEMSLWPGRYEELSGLPAQTSTAVAAVLLGLFTVFVINLRAGHGAGRG